MALADEPPSTVSADAVSGEETLAYYKSQYEQLELELAEFQASSRELETELERDIDASEKRERKLQEKVESLGFEVDEWKTKYKQSKAEANTVQSTLQKEITVLRDTNRSTQLKLRDIEVANDDIERQARNTTSSLEDLESKYNVAIERAVMLEAEIQVGEQERETLRIETQRLRDELSDLRIEAEITQEKLRRSDFMAAARNRSQQSLPAKTPLRPRSSTSDPSPASTASSPTRSTPPAPKSTSTSVSATPTPPSPPMSESSANIVQTTTVPSTSQNPKVVDADPNVTPRPFQLKPRLQRQSHGPSLAAADLTSKSATARRISTARPVRPQTAGSTSSSSLRQIRGLIGQMQKLEQRVHSARSKLPGPNPSPVQHSPQLGPVGGQEAIPASITVRSHRKRYGGSNVGIGSGSTPSRGDVTPSSTRHVSRLSFGIPSSQHDRRDDSRPSSRAGLSSHTPFSYHNGPAITQRPSSRASTTGARTPLGHHSTGMAGELRRPRSSIGGSYSSVHGHAHNLSFRVGSIEEKPSPYSTPTPRRTTLTRFEPKQTTGIPTPSAMSKRQSGGSRLAEPGFALTPSHRKAGTEATHPEREGEMGPPERRRRLSGVGETY